MRRHLALGFAIVVLAVNLILAIPFVARMRRAMALQGNKSVHLPVLPAEKQNQTSSHALELKLSTGGAVYSGDTLLTESSIQQLITSNPDATVTIQSLRGVGYDELKALLHKLQTYGVTHLTVKTAN